MKYPLLCLLFAAASVHAQPPVNSSAAETPPPAAAGTERDAAREWLNSLPAAPEPKLTKHGLIGRELRRWKAREADQGVAVDANHFYAIGNYVLGKYDKRTGERVAEWASPRGGPIIHMNYGYVDAGALIVSHSNFPQLPMASSVEYFDAATLQPVKSHSLGFRLGSLTWAQKKNDSWWVCFANYNDRGTTPGFDNRWTTFNQFDEHWQLQQSWLFPPQVVATFGKSSCSSGSWGDDGLLYVTGHDAKELYVLRLPKMGVTLEYVTTIDIPFEGQAWAWDRSEKRTIYGITRRGHEVISVSIPELPPELKTRR